MSYEKTQHCQRVYINQPFVHGLEKSRCQVDILEDGPVRRSFTRFIDVQSDRTASLNKG